MRLCTSVVMNVVKAPVCVLGVKIFPNATAAVEKQLICTLARSFPRTHYLKNQVNKPAGPETGLEGNSSIGESIYRRAWRFA